MKTMLWRRCLTALRRLSALVLLAPATSAVALPYTSLVVYGDSLSDNGNLYAAVGQPGSPYYGGRRSDGPVAVEQLAVSLGVPLIDFAWIGATTGVGNYADGGTVTSPGAYSLPGMTTVFDATKGYLAPYLAGGLFVVWAGPNDFLAPSLLDHSLDEIIQRAVANELAMVSELQSMGAHHLLVPGMPDLGLTPDFRGTAAAAAATAFSAAFNQLLSSALPAEAVYFDTAALLRSVVDDPARYHLTNVTDPCYDGKTVCADPQDYLFFDGFHPTTATDSLLAAAFYTSVVPEPASLALFGIGLAGLFLSRRRRDFAGAALAHCP